MNAIQYAVAVWCQHRHHHHFMHKIFKTSFFLLYFDGEFPFGEKNSPHRFFFIINSVRILWGKKSKTTNETWTGAAKPERQYQGNVRWFWWAQTKIENIRENIGAVQKLQDAKLSCSRKITFYDYSFVCLLAFPLVMWCNPCEIFRYANAKMIRWILILSLWMNCEFWFGKRSWSENLNVNSIAGMAMPLTTYISMGCTQPQLSSRESSQPLLNIVRAFIKISSLFYCLHIGWKASSTFHHHWSAFEVISLSINVRKFCHRSDPHEISFDWHSGFCVLTNATTIMYLHSETSIEMHAQMCKTYVEIWKVLPHKFGHWVEFWVCLGVFGKGAGGFRDL